MTTDPRLPAFLACARERAHPYYAAAAYRLAQESGDTVAMEEAIRLGAANYRREPSIYAWTEKAPCGHCENDACLRLSGVYWCEACHRREGRDVRLAHAREDIAALLDAEPAQMALW